MIIMQMVIVNTREERENIATRNEYNEMKRWYERRVEGFLNCEISDRVPEN